MNFVYVLVAVVVAASVAWFVVGQGMFETNTDNTTDATQTNEPTTFTGSAQDLLARNGSWQCDFSTTVNTVTVEGTTYIANGQMRSDTVTRIPNSGTLEGHMIFKDNTAYTWNNMTPQGIKMTMQGVGTQGGVGADAWANFNQAYGYNCKPWAVDNSKFTLPAGVTF